MCVCLPRDIIEETASSSVVVATHTHVDMSMLCILPCMHSHAPCFAALMLSPLFSIPLSTLNPTSSAPKIESISRITSNNVCVDTIFR